MNKYGIDIEINYEELDFIYKDNVYGPEVEIRRLDDIKKSLSTEISNGPEKVYGIAMDIYEEEDIQYLKENNLLFGAVVYAKGKLGDEPIRSQGHRHSVSKCGMSTGELYEIWSGEAIIYMQEYGTDNPGLCYAINAKAGDKVIVPPNWIHATVSANQNEQLAFGAWCVRDYGFDYEEVRAHHGIAYYPVYKNDILEWENNENYLSSELIIKSPRVYDEFGITDLPIYEQFKNDNDKFLFISQPQLVDWENFIP